MEARYDYLVIGSGIAGLFYALKTVEADSNATVAIITKKQETDSSTNRAQGGIAAVLAGTDSFESHVEDTLRAGAGLCHRKVVEQVVHEGPAVIQELIDYGVEFTRRDGFFDLGREGGHSANRVVHAEDLTGREIERALLAACRSYGDRVTIYRNHMAIDLLVSESNGSKRCVGASVLSENGEILTDFLAPITLLATGGMGQIYYHSSNPKIATGDGVAIAYRAGVPVGNLEFVQFHPTTLYSPGRWPFLISEAVRGEGARLRSVAGDYFMEEAHEFKDLAPRDIVARAIDKELKLSGEDYVLLDITHRDPEFVKNRFPNIYRQCLRYGFDITERAIPVVPAAHYACGGVVADIHGQTRLPGLFVAGEVAMTGMHGANRLASNSLLEAVVMAAFAARNSVAYRQEAAEADLPTPTIQRERFGEYPEEKILFAHYRRDLQRTMSDLVGIVRTEERLRHALGKVRRIKFAVDEFYQMTPVTYKLAEVRNMVQTALLVILSALERKESRGLQFLEDNPSVDDAYKHDTIIEPHAEEVKADQ
ncbi:L-aspartate oxidase [candidate division GN15 bacterium]|nr:L-aspartate oxidase [candidate division GN15 bacterium]